MSRWSTTTAVYAIAILAGAGGGWWFSTSRSPVQLSAPDIIDVGQVVPFTPFHVVWPVKNLDTRRSVELVMENSACATILVDDGRTHVLAPGATVDIGLTGTIERWNRSIETSIRGLTPDGPAVWATIRGSVAPAFEGFPDRAIVDTHEHDLVLALHPGLVGGITRAAVRNSTGVLRDATVTSDRVIITDARSTPLDGSTELVLWAWGSDRPVWSGWLAAKTSSAIPGE